MIASQSSSVPRTHVYAASGDAAPQREEPFGTRETGEHQVGPRAADEFVSVVIDAVLPSVVDDVAVVAPQRDEDFREGMPQRDRVGVRRKT